MSFNDELALTQYRRNKSPGVFALSFTIEETLSLSAELLRAVQIDSALLDSRLLLGHVKGFNALLLLTEKKSRLSESEFELFSKLLARRLCFEPIAYILGTKEFYGYDFYLSPDCLIPRPDTETVVEHCLALLPLEREARIWDICTGSGAIAISILKERPKCYAIASDISMGALHVAKKNASNLGVNDRLELLAGDLFEPFAPRSQADLIVCNPPYIGRADYEALAPDVKNYEPKAALLAGDEEGILFYRRIISDALRFLKSGGYLVLEIGYNQAEFIRKLIDSNFVLLGIYNDLADNPRVVVLKKV
jgi:release factor glutamine methyltransferase